MNKGTNTLNWFVVVFCRKSVIPSVMLSQAAQMKKVMPAPLKNVPREQPTSTMVTLGRSKLVAINTCG